MVSNAHTLDAFQVGMFAIQETHSEVASVGPFDFRHVAGRTRFLGNVIMRLVGLCFGTVGDPNSGLYILNRKAAALLCPVPLPTYPEPRMLTAFRQASLTVTTCVVPTLVRHAGTSSISTLWHSLKVFLWSLLEMVSWDPL